MYVNDLMLFIGEWNGICNEFQKMLFVRSLRTDRVSFCITNFIVNQLGPQFVEPPVLGQELNFFFGVLIILSCRH